jgi:subtilisin family serine protease
MYMLVRLSLLLWLALTLAGLPGKSMTAASTPGQELNDVAARKIAPWLMKHAGPEAETEFLVILAERAALQGAQALRNKNEKGRYVRQALMAKAQESQAALVAWLNERGIEHRAFYIVNALWVKADRATMLAIAARPEVARLESNPRIRNVEPAKLSEAEWQSVVSHLNSVTAPQAIEPGISNIRANEVWAQGFTGQGIVIGGADTGVEWNHPALINHYRGWNGTAANHDYNWHDSIHTTGSTCGPDTAAPCDDHGHGTHTIGTAVGDDGAGNQIGVAPGAKFIACRNMNAGWGTPATYIECMEWFLAPYPVGATTAQGDATKAPDITVNSWGCPPVEGCSPNTLQAAIEAQRAAGIMTVVAAGNSGSACSTVVDPPSFYDAAYTVGAINASDNTIASFSSRGPATIDGSNRRKPDITAPGVSVRSAARGGGYSYLGGTSMATPHVAGAVALLWSASPALRQQIALTENILNDAAVDVAVNDCSSSGVPNNVYGFGRMDIKAAVDLVGATVTPTSANFAAGGGTATVNVTAPAGVGWQTFVNDAWITINAGNSGSGNGVVSFSVAANTGAARTGSLVVAGRVVTVTQAAFTCSYAVSPLAASFSAAADNGSVNVTVDVACAWQAASNDAWIAVQTSNGVGSGTVNFTVTANTSVARTGTLTVAGQTVTIQQASGCTYGLSPSSRNHTASSGSATVSVSAAAGCPWTAASNDGWLTITAGANGTGNGVVSYAFSANTGPARTGTLTLAEQTFTVTQASGCTYTISPTSRSVNKNGGAGTVNVSTAAGCPWTATSNVAWITITANASGAGNGAVGYSVARNTGAKRTGTLTIAGKTFTINQAKG